MGLRHDWWILGEGGSAPVAGSLVSVRMGLPGMEEPGSLVSKDIDKSRGGFHLLP